MFTFQALLARRQALFMLAALAGAGLSWAETEVYKTIDWNDLMPDPWVKEMSKDMAAMSKLSYLQDSSDEATKAMSAIRKKLDEAPIVKTQLNKKVRIPGYAVPLDAERSDKREFLLVPYFGACIHTPPPPANQIVLVRPTAQSKIKKNARIHGRVVGGRRIERRPRQHRAGRQRLFAGSCQRRPV